MLDPKLGRKRSHLEGLDPQIVGDVPVGVDVGPRRPEVADVGFVPDLPVVYAARRVAGGGSAGEAGEIADLQGRCVAGGVRRAGPVRRVGEQGQHLHAAGFGLRDDAVGIGPVVAASFSFDRRPVEVDAHHGYVHLFHEFELLGHRGRIVEHHVHAHAHSYRVGGGGAGVTGGQDGGDRRHCGCDGQPETAAHEAASGTRAATRSTMPACGGGAGSTR